MKLERVVDILGKVIGKKFIIRRLSSINPTFKVFSTYSIEAHVYDGKDFILFHKHESTLKTNEPKGIEEIEENFLKELLEKCYGI